MPTHAWVNDRLAPADAPQLLVADRGFQLGDAIFETMRARRGVVIELDEHLERLRESAVPLGIALPADDAPIVAAIRALLRADDLAGDGSDGRPPGDAAIRVTVSRGAFAVRGLAPRGETTGPTMVVQAWPHAEPAPEVLSAGLSLITSAVRRDPGSPLAGVKSTSRAENVYARLEAGRAGADDALLLTIAGEVCESTSANLFTIRGERLVTPPLSSGCLAGTTRAWLLVHAASHGLAAAEEPITPAAVAAADEVFLSSSVAGVLPVTRMDGNPIGRGGPGPFTIQLRRAREAWIDRASQGRP
jgi:branched-chain amino acid aminotransferase